MIKLINKYLNKLYDHGLANKNHTTFIAFDTEIISNRTLNDRVKKLKILLDKMNINSLLYAEPTTLYSEILSHLAENDYIKVDYSSTEGIKKYDFIKKIIPLDSESRMFLNDIPIISKFSLNLMDKALSVRKSVIVGKRKIITHGSLTPEQAFINFSSTCFAILVKYFFDSLYYIEKLYNKNKKPENTFLEAFNVIRSNLENTFPQVNLKLKKDNFEELQIKKLLDQKLKDENEISDAISYVGKVLVKHRLVNSCFGNLSYVFGDKIYITQTGSSLDELHDSIEAVPLDGSSTVGITASSEYSTHKKIYYTTGNVAIVHGHPPFSVIMSLYCTKRDCPNYSKRHLCNTLCKEQRQINGIPIVIGEIGTGIKGIVNTVPISIKKSGVVLVYGHGVFASAMNFNKALSLIFKVEDMCRRKYFRLIDTYLQRISV
ncbi:MAG: class II aldolase/adducin family protein [Thermodesulfovibrionales bacterium]|nr:class II aldolase/adducin family protein [Thermodesulfovibrionales bacterium]